MIEAVNAGIRGSGAIGATDAPSRLRHLEFGDFDPRFIAPREGLIWAQPQPPVQFVQTAPPTIGAVAAPTTRDLALMAADVYNDIAMPPAGYRVATENDLGRLGLRPQDLTSATSAFRARIYVNSASQSVEYVVAFRGTTNSNDWQANLRQGVGLSSDHYTRALIIGRALARNPDANVTITGHSLGGGLASATAIASGRNASTFNAAGLSDATVGAANRIRSAAGIGRAVEVQAFYVRGEVLSAIQDGGDRVIGAIFGGARGAVVANAPEAYGTRVPLSAVQPVGQPWYSDTSVARHGMDWVLSSLGRQ